MHHIDVSHFPYAPYFFLMNPTISSFRDFRFGNALAKTRTKFQKRIRRRAYKFLKEARKDSGDYDSRPRVNRAWLAGADLQPILNYLTQR